MNFKSQVNAIDQLKLLASYDRHSVLIEGVEGCGKTYLVKYYAELLDIEDVVIIDPTVNSIRDTLNTCYSLNNRIVVGVENLDLGVFAASSALLKFLEEPTPNVYLVVTARNIQKVADTIISRSAVVSVSPPIQSDVEIYAANKDNLKFNKLKSNRIWKPVRSFKDVDLVFKFSPEQQDYYSSLDSLKFTDTVSNIVWYLGHYSDNTETPVDYVIRYIMKHNPRLRKFCMECLTELSYNRIATHATLAKFVFDCKYGE